MQYSTGKPQVHVSTLKLFDTYNLNIVSVYDFLMKEIRYVYWYKGQDTIQSC